MSATPCRRRFSIERSEIFHHSVENNIVLAASDQIRESHDGDFAVGYDLMVINIHDEIRVRRAIVGDKTWPVLI